MNRFESSHVWKLAAMDDPVPSLPESLRKDVEAQESPVPHAVECEVLHRLKHSRGLRFQELSVHRLPDGVCLMGVVKIDDSGVDICEVAKKVEGVIRVVNRLVIH
jgi:osmotically-inducible protein OsmY